VIETLIAFGVAAAVVTVSAFDTAPEGLRAVTNTAPLTGLLVVFGGMVITHVAVEQPATAFPA